MVSLHSLHFGSLNRFGGFPSLNRLSGTPQSSARASGACICHAKSSAQIKLPIPNTLLTRRDFIWRERREYQNVCPFVKIFSDRIKPAIEIDMNLSALQHRDSRSLHEKILLRRGVGLGAKSNRAHSCGPTLGGSAHADS